MYRTRTVSYLISLFRIAALLMMVSAALSPKIGQAEETPLYTGILIDARHLPTIDRSPAPKILSPEPDSEILYPDSAHVPNPDEVQEQSVVRYYHTEDEAHKGFVGENPLILRAVEVVGPAHDNLRLSAKDTVTLREADKAIGFTKSWKVGFMLPADR